MYVKRILLTALAVVAFSCTGEEVRDDSTGTGRDIEETTTPVEPEVFDSEPLFSLKVATVNLLKPSGRPGEMSLEKKVVKDALGASIAETGASLIAFNEVDENYIPGGMYSLEDMLSAVSPGMAGEDWEWSLEWPNSISNAAGKVGYSYANGFAFDGSVLELKESGYVWLDKTTNGKWYTNPAEAYGKVGSPNRTCIWARFIHRESGKEFWFFVTHLPTKDQGGGVVMAYNVCRFARNVAGESPIVLCGDMNSAPGTDSKANAKVYEKLRFYLNDAFETVSTLGDIGPYAAAPGTLSGSSSKYYYSVSTFTTNHPERRIDHIMTLGKCSAATYATVSHTYNYDGKPWCPSDHLPVVAEIVFYK